MDTHFSHEELELIEQLVGQAVSGLGPEIHHTWSRDYRKDLQERRDKLESLQRRLREILASVPAAV